MSLRVFPQAIAHATIAAIAALALGVEIPTAAQTMAPIIGSGNDSRPGHTSKKLRVPPGWKAYESPDYGFAIAYPENMTFYAERPDFGAGGRSYIPICERTTVGCFAYEGDEYKGTNFSGAGLSVNILRDARTQSDCGNIDSWQGVRPATIHGVHFRFGLTGEGAMGQWTRGKVYRTLHDGVCFEVRIGIEGTAINDPGTMREFDSAKLDKELEAMLNTFRFVGPIVDGAGWMVYHGQNCGETFEYPDGDAVVDSSQYPVVNDEIACEAYFVDGGRKYMVQTKQHQDGNAFETWLKTARYQDDSTRPRLIKRSEDYMIFEVGSSYYLFLSGKLFILSMSDLKEGPLDEPASDPVFRHLVNSFKETN